MIVTKHSKGKKKQKLEEAEREDDFSWLPENVFILHNTRKESVDNYEINERENKLFRCMMN
jgi:hypothetical protein